MRRVDTERSAALSQAKCDIANRIRRVCAEFGEAEFDQLVEKMALIDLRYRFRDDWGMFPERN